MNRTHYIYIIALLLLFGAAMPLHAQTIRGKIYGGGQLATVDGNALIQVYSGTVGDGTDFDGGVFGGGLGEPTIVTGNVEVIIGRPGAAKDAAGPTINGDVYGGSALGNTNCSAELVGTDSTTSVMLNAGTINGSMYGGALGQKNGVGGADKDVAANVYGAVQVDVNGGIVQRRVGDDAGTFSGGIYGCNNFNGSPQTEVNVDIYHHNSAQGEDKYALFAVYGGGNQADYIAGTPNVTVHYCDNNIEYVYGGGNAAHLTHATDDGDGNMVGDGNTNVIIWGCDSIGNVFGGGNGQVQAANVSGNTSVTIHGGKILNVFGGSNTNGMIGGATNVHVLAQGEVDPNDVCLMDVTNVYGGGNKAAGKSGTVEISCTGTGTIKNVYGGANMADLTGDIELNIRGGKIGNVFGGNNVSGTINGAIAVNVDWITGDGACGTNSLGNVYGGGNLAAYYAYGYDSDWIVNPADPTVSGPTVNIINAHISGNVFGGGKGDSSDDSHATGAVTGNPAVVIGSTADGTLAQIDGNVFGGGDAANVIGTPSVLVQNCSTVIGTKDGNGNWNSTGGTVYGGGNAAHITGDGNGTNVTINGGEIHRAFAGGNGEVSPANIAGNAQIAVHAGLIGQVFAGSNQQGSVDGSTSVTIDHENTGCDEKVQEVYGGGNLAAGPSGEVSIECGAIVGDVYGGANQANISNDIILNITGGTIDRAFGGNNTSGSISGTITVNVNKADDCDLNLGSVFGAGNQAAYTGNPVVNIQNGKVDDNVYGGGLGATAIVYGNPQVTIGDHNDETWIAEVGGDVYGGGDAANVVGTAKVEMVAGTIGIWNDGVCTSGGDIYGGGNAADVTNTNVLISGGTTNRVFGGGHGNKGTGVDDPERAAANVAKDSEGNGGNAVVKVEGGTITQVFAAGNSLGAVEGQATLTIEKKQLGNDATDDEIAALPKLKVEEAYGGGNEADGNAGTLIVGCTGGNEEYVKDVYGGARNAEVTSDITLNINGGNIDRVFGGNNVDGNVLGAIEVNIDEEEGSCGLNLNNVYGGGNQAGYDPTEDTDFITVNIKNGTVKENVYGGGLGETAVVKSNPAVNLEGGTILGYVFGGGEEAPVVGDPAVTLKGSTVGTWDAEGNLTSGGDVFAGGNLATVNGNPQVTATEGKANDIFAGGKGEPAVVTGITLAYVNLADGKELTIRDVYGGGDAANVDGTAKVEMVAGTIGIWTDGVCTAGGDIYGGGNAADVTNTNVLISGGTTNRVFGGGHGNKGTGVDDPERAAANVAKDSEGNGGNAVVKVEGGTITQVFAAGNSLGAVEGQATLTIEKKQLGNDATDDEIAALPKLKVEEAYGGGNEADGNAGTVIVGCTGGNEEYVKDVYGGARNAEVTSDITLNINGGNIDRVFGGNNVSGNVTGAIQVNIDEDPESCGLDLNNVYGGGNLAGYVPTEESAYPEVNIKNGTVKENVYGGGLGASAIVVSNPTVTVSGGTVSGNVFGGGSEANTTGKTTVTISGGTVSEDVYGGGALANVSGNTSVVISGGTSGDVYGGGLGSAKVAATVGNVSVRVESEGVANNVFGCNNINGAPTGTVNVEIAGGTIYNNVYGGGNLANATVSPVVTVSGGIITHDVYGGGALADIEGNTTVNLTGGTITGNAYGGGLGSKTGVNGATEDVAAVVSGKANITLGAIDGEGVKSGNCVVGSIFGCNYMNGAPVQGAIVTTYSGNATNVYGGGNLAAATVSPQVTVSGGTVTEDVFGGGYGTTAVINGDPVVTISDGTVTGAVYGGGALADVKGNTTVKLTGGTIGGAYGGALGQLASAAVGTLGDPGYEPAKEAIAAKVNGDTYVHLDGSKVTETGIFGANNLNGTPTGHVKVHVTKTTPRDGQTAYDPEHPENSNSYDVPAVYGGGNLSAYVPSDETFAAGKGFAEVLIENCDNSIEYVYGGGNAAPVPATKVTIYGANAINYAFAGGNGAGQSTDPSAPNYNPGADVGYKGYYSQNGEETPTYGTGETHITIYGGTINNVYGGSNTLGYIRTHAYVEVLNVPDGDTEHNCELHLGEVQAGGNEAEMYCGGSVTLACSEGADVVYAGSSDADIHGDIDLVITSGTYGTVFGGNNKSGNVYGHIKIDIDETGCWPVMIGELYACGNKAPYSVYGYTNEGPRTKVQYDAMTNEERIEAGLKDKDNNPTPYGDPTINLISFTRIGKVFGGGYAAAVYGDPIINVDPIKGKYAGKTVGPVYVLNENDKRITNDGSSTLPYGITWSSNNIVIPNEVGSIGTIYGGGNKGVVFGNTNVLIGLKSTNKHIKDKDDDSVEADEVAVTITGDVFGGGKMAVVTGDTNVTIGQ